MASSFQRFASGIVPWFMRQRFFAVILESFGLTLDGLTQQGQDSVFAGNPLLCELDVLSLLCRDRKTRRYPTELEESIRVRLATWRQRARHKGSAYGVQINLQPYFLPGKLPTIRIVHQAGDGANANWWTLNPDGTREFYSKVPSNWNFDGVAAKWSRFWVIVDITGTRFDTTAPEYGDGGRFGDVASGGSGEIYGGVPLANATDMIAMVNEAKRAASVLWGFIITTNGAAFDPAGSSTTLPDGSTTYPAGTWGPLISPTTHGPTRPPYAIFYTDLGQG